MTRCADSTKRAFFPDPNAEPERFPVLVWQMLPGDAVLFDDRAVHGARPNMTAARRRAFSLRFVGDDARCASRPGRTLPPFPGCDMQPGQRLREDWFPAVWPRRAAMADTNV